MEISFAKNSFPLLQLSIKFWYNSNFRNTCRKQSTVELVHKIYGNLDGNSPIIILHGLLGSKKNWDSMSQKLRDATDRAVVAVDARNHGESPHAPSHLYVDLAMDVKKLMEKRRIQEAIVIGHSMGGRTAMVLALTKPSKVSNLIVVDISPISSPSVLSSFFPRLMDVMKSIKFDGVKDVPTARDLAKQKLKISPLDMDLGTINFVLMNIGKRDGKIAWNCNIKALTEHFTKIASFPIELAGKVYQGPTLFIAGEESHFIPKEDINAIQAIFPLSKVKYVENAGHNVHVDKPAVFIEFVRNFISEYSM